MRKRFHWLFSLGGQIFRMQHNLQHTYVKMCYVSSIRSLNPRANPFELSKLTHTYPLLLKLNQSTSQSPCSRFRTSLDHVWISLRPPPLKDLGLASSVCDYFVQTCLNDHINGENEPLSNWSGLNHTGVKHPNTTDLWWFQSDYGAYVTFEKINSLP